MKRVSTQAGMSFFGVMFLLVILGFGVLLGLKLFPIYMESLKIDAALTGVIENPEVSKQSKRDIVFSLIRRLDIDSVDRITERNWKDYVTIDRSKEKVAITVQYRAETPLFANLSLAADFKKHVEN